MRGGLPNSTWPGVLSTSSSPQSGHAMPLGTGSFESGSRQCAMRISFASFIEIKPSLSGVSDGASSATGCSASSIAAASAIASASARSLLDARVAAPFLAAACLAASFCASVFFLNATFNPSSPSASIPPA